MVAKSSKPIFSHRTETVPATVQGMNKFVEETNPEFAINNWIDWARKVLEGAGAKVAGRWVLRGYEVPTFLEWRAERVLGFATSAIDHLKKNNARDAVYCALRAQQAFHAAFVNDRLAPFYWSGRARSESGGHNKGSGEEAENDIRKRFEELAPVVKKKTARHEMIAAEQKAKNKLREARGELPLPGTTANSVAKIVRKPNT